MRFVGVVGFLLCGTAFGQSLDINGYSKVVIPVAQGDYFDYNSMLREAVRDAGFELYRSVEELPAEDRPKTLHMTAGMTSDVAHPKIFIAVFDVVTQAGIAACTRELEGIASRYVRRTIERLVEDMAYQGFDQSAHDANVQARRLVATATEQSTSPTAAARPNAPRMNCRR